VKPEDFCSPFDHALAIRGPGAVFLRDPEGLLRFDPEWTRDAWGRARGDPGHEPRWVLARDRDSGYVLLVLVTSPALLADHPRLDLRSYPTADEARVALAALGRPPIATEPW
jgi:hypothetical protein